eukprot:UN14828
MSIGIQTKIEGGIILSRKLSGIHCSKNHPILNLHDYYCEVLEEWMDVMAFEGGRFINEEEDIIPNDPDFVGTRNDQS